MNLAARQPVLLVAVPLVFAATCPLWGMWKRRICFYWALGGMSVTAFLAWSLIGKVSQKAPLTYNVSGWRPPWGIQIRIDTVGLLLACTITAMSILLLLYSYRYVEKEIPTQRIVYYYTLLLLIFTAMLGCSVTGDLFNFFVFMEIFSITSYALVAISGERRAIRAALKYLLMGATSSLTVLLAISFLYSVTGSLNMVDIGQVLERMGRTSSPYLPVAAAAMIFFIAGFCVKAAVFPVHVWLPEAHSIAPSPVSALLSALVIKMGVLGIIRTLFTVYGRGFSSFSEVWGALATVLSWAAALSIPVAAIMAIMQTDLKVMIAYSSVVHVGYIVLGISVLSVQGFAGGLFNIVAHAMGKGCFFLVAGIIIYKHGFRRIDDLKGLGRSMPVTAGAFAIASLSIVGLPPSAGFIAKWNILYGCLQQSQYIQVVLALFGSMLSAVYCFKVVYYMFFTGSNVGAKMDEGPMTMLIPVTLLAAGTVFFGIFSALLMPTLSNAARVLLAR
ncbi:MAG: monovalent cation/H+ antiporter subunit D family protein [Actinobacteria bacterium]|nr:monovalent cation/H+ antiporter subunit D family protein [Actinomycetota bacterium]MBU2686266.1 monovalent cation/H+ antiporter subunit D family protein [Actinomycetota bacterium]